MEQIMKKALNGLKEMISVIDDGVIIYGVPGSGQSNLRKR